MRNLNFKVPPALLAILFIFLMWVVSYWLPVNLWLAKIKRVGFLVLTTVGFLIAFLGILSFKRQKTTINPTKPNKSTSLVTSGIYRITRNPMYLGMLLVLVGWGVYLANGYAFIFCMGFVSYMNRFQIKPEEEILLRKFGNQFVIYKNKTRRWL